MKLSMLSICGLLACVVGAFPLNPSFTPEAVAAYKAKADAGDAEAQYLYSSALANGEGIAEDEPQAFVYAKKAAEQGYVRALYFVGRGYEKGWGIEANAAKAAECYAQYVAWASKVAERGDAEVQCKLGCLYYYGKGVKADMEAAVNLFRKSAESGDVNGECNLGAMFERGEGVRMDLEEAASWYHKAAEQGDVRAGLRLVDVQDRLSGEFLFNGLMSARHNKNMVDAAMWFRKSAVRGNVDAQCFWGWCCAKGVGVSQDLPEAMKWIRRAADHGNFRAQLSLGWCYANGFGVAKSIEKSERWYRKAVMQNAGKVICYLILFGLDIRMTILCVLVAVYCLLIQLILYGNSHAQILFDWRVGKSSRLMRCCELYGEAAFGLIPIGALAALLCEIFCVTEVMPCGFGRFIEVSTSGVVGCPDPKCIYTSVVVALFMLLISLIAIEGMSIRRLVKCLRKKSVGKPNITFSQYAKVDALGKSALCGLGIATGICFALMGYDIQAVQVLLGTVVVILCTLPTRKKFDKILNGKPKKVALVKFIVIYREPGEPQPKQTVLENSSELSLCRECEDKGWRVLLIRRANEWSSGDLVLRQQKRKKAHFTESQGFVLLVVALVVAVLPFGLEAIGEATGLFGFPASRWMKEAFAILTR